MDMISYCNQIPADTSSADDGWIGSSPDRPSSSIVGSGASEPKPANNGNGGGWLGSLGSTLGGLFGGGGRGSGGFSDDNDDDERKRRV
jgi:hypothetical protein